MISKISKFSDKAYLFFACFIISLFACLFFLGTRETIPEDKAIFEYRKDFKKQKTHNLTRLKEILYLQAKHTDPLVRRNVAEVVGELAEPDIDFLWNVVQTATENYVAHAAIEGMYLSRDKAAIKYLLITLKHEDVFLRRKAAESLSEFKDISITTVLSKQFNTETDVMTKISIAEALIKQTDTTKNITPKILPLIEFINDSLMQNISAEIRLYAAQRILFLDLPIDNIKFYQNIFDNEQDPYVKIWIASILAKKGDIIALNYLKSLLSKKTDQSFMSEVTYALTEIEEYEYVYPLLVKQLKKAADFKSRELAIENLIYFKNYPLTPLLGETLLNDDSFIVREIAAWAMGERKEVAAIPYLDKGLYDKSAFVRTGVIAALYKILTHQVNLKSNI